MQSYYIAIFSVDKDSDWLTIIAKRYIKKHIGNHSGNLLFIVGEKGLLIERNIAS